VAVHDEGVQAVVIQKTGAVGMVPPSAGGAGLLWRILAGTVPAQIEHDSVLLHCRQAHTHTNEEGKDADKQQPTNVQVGYEKWWWVGMACPGSTAEEEDMYITQSSLV
jgi:hypothetical protein